MKLFENGKNRPDTCEKGFEKTPRVVIIRNDANDVPNSKVVGTHYIWQKLVRIYSKISIDSVLSEETAMQMLSMAQTMGIYICFTGPDKGYRNAFFVEGSLYSYLELFRELGVMAISNSECYHVMKGIGQITSAAYTYIITPEQMDAIGSDQFDSNDVYSTPVNSNNPYDIIKEAESNGIKLNTNQIWQMHFIGNIKSLDTVYKKQFILASDFYVVASDGLYVSIDLWQIKNVASMYAESVSDVFGENMLDFINSL